MSKNTSNFVVTIDGPAGAGKSTVARNLARKLGLIHLNSGALFRAVGLKAVELGISLSSDEELAKLAESISFKFVLNAKNETELLVGGEDVSEKILTESAGELASKIAVLPKLRETLLHVQRNVAKGNSVVVEGRDAGTVVFPDAKAKFYLVASLDVRALRRYLQLSEKQQTPELEKIKLEIQARDTRDSSREIAPSVAAKDAEVVDTSDLTVDDVVERICKFIY
jgi:cytidylate kinase